VDAGTADHGTNPSALCKLSMQFVASRRSSPKMPICFGVLVTKSSGVRTPRRDEAVTRPAITVSRVCRKSRAWLWAPPVTSGDRSPLLPAASPWSELFRSRCSDRRFTPSHRASISGMVRRTCPHRNRLPVRRLVRLHEDVAMHVRRSKTGRSAAAADLRHGERGSSPCRNR
jgi:hypothetical protein